MSQTRLIAPLTSALRVCLAVGTKTRRRVAIPKVSPDAAKYLLLRVIQMLIEPMRCSSEKSEKRSSSPKSWIKLCIVKSGR